MVYSLLWGNAGLIRLMIIEILHYLKDPKPWELWYIPAFMG